MMDNRGRGGWRILRGCGESNNHRENKKSRRAEGRCGEWRERGESSYAGASSSEGRGPMTTRERLRDGVSQQERRLTVDQEKKL